MSALAVPAPRPGGRRILLLSLDVFAEVGGGQTAYRRLIDLRPQDAWFYFRRNERAEAPRPANAFGIELLEPFAEAQNRVPEHLHHFLWNWRTLRNMSRSIIAALGRTDFDVADTPDFEQFGAFIRPALAMEGCRVGTVALSLHGTLSDAFRGGWPTGQDERRLLAGLRMREHLQFRAADARYAVSDAYAEAWQRRAPLAVHRLDPLVVTGAPDPRPADRAEGAPDLAFVGRREKWKGPDLFLDAAWCIDAAAYRRLLLLGPEGPNRLGHGSEDLLRAVAGRRGLTDRLEMPGGVPPAALRELFDGRTVLLLPSRHDTFNLTALEAISRGCPTLVSHRAGVARWLRDRLPGLDWAVVGIDCGHPHAAAAAAVLAEYDRYREALCAALARAGLQPDTSGVEAIHRPHGDADARAQQVAIEVAALLDEGLQEADDSSLRCRAEAMAGRGGEALRQVAGAAGRALPVGRPLRRAWERMPTAVRADVADIAARLRAVAAKPDRIARRAEAIWQADDAIRFRGRFDPKAYGQVRQLRRLPDLAAELRGMPERSREQVEAKLRRLTQAVTLHSTDRVALFREMARLERRAGNPLTAVTYLLRTLRWLGADPRGDLPFVAATLREQGYPYEADIAEAMFGSAPDGHARSLELLRDAWRRNLDKPELPLAALDDRRGPGAVPRVAVIASLYNAADKLPTLLAMCARQTIRAQGGLEVVLVDSASPADERGAFAAFAAAHPDLPIVYARSARRETIQCAWNRGIRLSRAPYLAFLGADEGLHPDALRLLADTLDAEPAVDWAMADSIVTNVDRHGVFDSDIMVYDRSGYRQDLVYLETCYLSFVGGLYRRSIHDRFGWYDETFRGAGDTEFKSRVMPHIRSIHVKRPLGLFNNYPEERTTQSPRAEIEDLRAWYAWRSAAGMDYAFAQRPAEDAVALLRDCFGYRKSFCGHLSTDYDLAAALADHLMRRPDRPDLAAAAFEETRDALALIREFETLPARFSRPVGRIEARVWGLGRLQAAQAAARRQRERLGLAETPPFAVFNDNRYEQHWWSWSAA